MKAICVGNDEYNSLYVGDVPTPEPQPTQVLIRTRATAVNRADLLQRRGFYPPPPGESEVLGLEAAGEVTEVGAAVSGWRAGDRVCCLLGGGGYAEYTRCDARMLLPIPQHMTYEEAAAIPEVFYTAFVNLFLEAGLRAGERVLIHAGASGVGTAAIQLARAEGAAVWVTVGSSEKARRCLALGAHHAIEYKSEEFADRVGRDTQGVGVDVILDCVGGAYFEGNLASLAARGRLVIIGAMGGTSAQINLRPLMTRRLRVVGSVLRSRTLEEKIAITDQFRRRVWPLFEEKKLRPVIDSVFSLYEAEAAHQRMTENRNFGKITLTVPARSAECGVRSWGLSLKTLKPNHGPEASTPV